MDMSAETGRQRLPPPLFVRVLLAEDVDSDAELAVRELKRAGMRVLDERVETELDYRNALAGFSPDVIISDFAMPNFDGMSALIIAREICADIPFIFVSGAIGEEYAIRALQAGATDYVLKSDLVRLPSAVERAIHDARTRVAKRETERALEIQRERLTSIFTSLPDMLWSISLPDRRVLYVSPAALTIYGRTTEEFIANPDLWFEVIHPDDKERVSAARRRMLRGEEFDIEHRIVRLNGDLRWIHTRRRIIRNASGVPERVDSMAREITEQVEYRLRIARLSRVRDFICSINSALVRLRQRGELFAEICRIAVTTGGFLSARIGTLNPASLEVSWKAEAGISCQIPSCAATSPREGHEFDAGIVGESLRVSAPKIWDDVATDSGVQFRKSMLGEGAVAAGSFPLIVERRAVGVLLLHSAERRFFDSDEVGLLTELSANISFALELFDKRERLDYLALFDALTGLPNRTLFLDRLEQAVETANRGGERLALVVFDLERFGAINDTLGRHSGDRVLRHVADRLQEMGSDLNRVARLGGDMFAVMIPDVGSAAQVVHILGEATARFVEAPLLLDGHELRIGTKSGIALFPDDGENADILFRNAEASLKRAKETGDSYLFYAPQMNARVAEQLTLEHKLRRAVENNEFFLHYQPKFELTTRRLVGFEALLRWSPERSPQSPSAFVPVLEQTGLILDVGKQVIATAAATYRDWKARGLNPPRIAVNVSILQLRQKHFVSDVRAAIGGEDAAASGVDLEITESLLMVDIDESIRKLREIRSLGMCIALDDFGTGHSSLAYLSKLPIDSVKIDRGFVSGMADNADDISIVSAIISLAQALGLNVVAEGVETDQQAQLLRLLRCDQLQGYLVSPPVAHDAAEAMLVRAARDESATG